ncbi:MAG: sugar phosphate isomerase/epimerase family protein [Thermoguttaceae bacterium]
MKTTLDRRTLLARAGVAAAAGVSGLLPQAAAAAQAAQGAPNAEKLGWRLGCQAYSFNRFSFFEAVEKTASLGLRYIEAYPGQRLGGDHPELRISETMPAEARAEVRRKLADSQVKLVCFGVTGLRSDEAAARRTFEFAKQMGIETIVSEPAPDCFDLLDKLCEQYGINVAIHNHPEPSPYWNPEKVLAVCKGRSKRIGACADTGHWMRSGIKPIDAVRKLEGRIISFHFKDLDTYGRAGHDVPWGTGKGDVKAVLQELRRQGFQGVFSIEYEYNWLNSLPEIAQCVAYFDQVAAELL